MIIHMTFCDNDFTHYLEEFCNGLRNKMFQSLKQHPELPKERDIASVNAYIATYNEWRDYEKYMEDTRNKLLNPEHHFARNSAEYKQICDEVIRLWNEFAKTCDMEEWVPYVSIQYELEEKWENGEAVYYFTAYDKFITQ